MKIEIMAFAPFIILMVILAVVVLHISQPKTVRDAVVNVIDIYIFTILILGAGVGLIVVLDDFIERLSMPRNLSYLVFALGLSRMFYLQIEIQKRKTLNGDIGKAPLKTEV